MEKIKVNIDEVFEGDKRTIEDKNGNGVVILNWIPFEEKEAFVEDLVGLSLNSNDELGICYEAMNYELLYNFVFVKYYTNIDVSDIPDVDGLRKLYDYCQMNGITREALGAYVEDDLKVIDNMIIKYKNAVKVLYETEHSLGYAVKKLLETKPDINNQETRELIEKLIDMKGALIEKEEESKVIAFGKKKPADLKTGGVKIGLAKR